MISIFFDLTHQCIRWLAGAKWDLMGYHVMIVMGYHVGLRYVNRAHSTNANNTQLQAILLRSLIVGRVQNGVSYVLELKFLHKELHMHRIGEYTLRVYLSIFHVSSLL